MAPLKNHDVLTKRTLTSDIARTFDVLGWFTPSTITMKIILQSLWETGINWDSEVPIDLRRKWQDWRNQLDLLSNHAIPRYYFTPESEVEGLQLHGFSDASQRAYAAVVYLRATYKNSPTTISLVLAKSKVAPLKGETIPQLELAMWSFVTCKNHENSSRSFENRHFSPSCLDRLHHSTELARWHSKEIESLCQQQNCHHTRVIST